MNIPEIGQLVIVRKRPFVVVDKIKQNLPPKNYLNVQTHLMKLSSVEDDSQGEELSIIWEIEPGTEIIEDSLLPKPEGFDDPKVLDAFLNAVNWGAISRIDQKNLQAPFRSGIEIDEYQLDPVVRALSMPRVNLMIADDTGLGKTIEAGLVIQEMLLRHRARTVLIICPSSLQMQWKEEMRDKFGLEFRIIDSEAISQLRKKRGIRVNPWSHFPRLITSIDFFKRERVLRLFRETISSGEQVSYPRPYDLLVIDEAHNIAPSGRGRYAVESMRTNAIRMITKYFEHKLFLSATPHNGYRESFSALLELLDNQRFARSVMPDRKQLEAVMIRRMKSELTHRSDGQRRFADRIVDTIEVQYSEADLIAHKTLVEYSKSRLSSIKSESERFAVEFVLKTLKKRLFSSPAAFKTTIDKHAKSNSGSGDNYIGSTAWRRQIESAEEEYYDDEEYENAASDALMVAGKALSGLSSEDKKRLKELQEYAANASLRPDSKAQAIIKWMKDNIKPGGKWCDQRVIIFTEYRTTQKWLYNILATEGFAENDRLLMLFGGMPLDKREDIKAAFQAGPEESKVRILLATDAASEGVNLQNHCSKLIHYEIPWNPNRMEQRNGRIDRHGQRAEKVNIFHFVGKGFNISSKVSKASSLESDLEFLMRAVMKVENIREDLGKVGPVIASQVEGAMLGRLITLDTTAAERDAEPVRKMLKFERQLRQQLEKLAAQLYETKEELRLSPENIENVVRVGLELAGQPQIIDSKLKGIWPDQSKKTSKCPVFNLPPLSEGWAQCAHGLQHPHTKAIRPIVFDQTLMNGRDDLVLAHLNHRLVQMCLRLLRAKLWSNSGSKSLNRVCARVMEGDEKDTIYIIAHGRIVVLGGDNQRLHEEIIMAGGSIKSGRFSRLNVSDCKKVYESAGDKTPPQSIESTLMTAWEKHISSLYSALEARMSERTKNLEKNLVDISEKEIQNFTSIMNELAKSIQKELGDQEIPQQLNLFTEEEKGQRERDVNALRRRLNEIPEELARETKHLSSHYSNPTPRLFPVAVTFVIPSAAISNIEQGGRL